MIISIVCLSRGLCFYYSAEWFSIQLVDGKGGRSISHPMDPVIRRRKKFL